MLSSQSATGQVRGAFEKYLHADDALPPLVAGGLVETTGKRRDCSFGHRGYLDRLRVGTELGSSGRAAATLVTRP